nr:MAG: putative RNA-dependent RNA polymerase [Partitiviridae sp.]
MRQFNSFYYSAQPAVVQNNLEFKGIDTFPPKSYRARYSAYTVSAQKTARRAIARNIHNREELDMILDGYRRCTADEFQSESFFMSYDVEPHLTIKDDKYWQAMRIATEWFRPPRLLRPVHYTDLRWYPWNLTSSCERPFKNSKYWRRTVKESFDLGLLESPKMNFHNLYNAIFEKGRQYIHNIKEGNQVRLFNIELHQKPALVKYDDPDKVRTVFGVPKYWIFAEAMFYWPLYNQYQRYRCSPLLWGYETLNGGWARLNDEFYSLDQSYSPIINLDWSGFDTHLYFDVISDIRENILSYFDLENGYIPTKEYVKTTTNPNRLLNLWNWHQTALEKTLCVSPTGRVFARKYAGMPSGIFTTQYIDSFYNLLMILTTMLALKLPILPKHFIKVMGDDALIGFIGVRKSEDYSSFIEAFSSETKRRFGAVLNAEKCHVSQNIQNAKVLGYSNFNGYPQRDRTQLLAQLLHSKHAADNFERLKARSVGIYYASAGDPVVRRVCKDIFDFLDYNGIRANRNEFRNLFDPETAMNLRFDPDYFPTPTEAICRLMRPSRRSEEVDRLYWNRDHFIDEA